MRYALLMHYREPGEGDIPEEAIAEAMVERWFTTATLAGESGIVSAPR